MASLRSAKAAGIRAIMFTSDNFNHALNNLRQPANPKRKLSVADKMGSLAMFLFVRYRALRRAHPMSGGVARVRRDCANDYRSLRKSPFGCELAPLPSSLALPAAEQLIQPERKIRAG